MSTLKTVKQKVDVQIKKLKEVLGNQCSISEMGMIWFKGELSYLFSGRFFGDSNEMALIVIKGDDNSIWIQRSKDGKWTSVGQKGEAQ